MGSKPQPRDEPSYLGLLNAIAVAERRNGELLSAWRDVTPDAALAALLNLVAIREYEHGAAFTKRICELGYHVSEPPSDEFGRRLALARSRKKSDAKKFRRLLGYGKKRDRARTDRLAGLLSDASIDPPTGALLGRFIAEERDSERRLRVQHARVCSESTA